MLFCITRRDPKLRRPSEEVGDHVESLSVYSVYYKVKMQMNNIAKIVLYEKIT